MQIILNVPDMIPQEIVNKLLTQWKNQLYTEEILAKNLSLNLQKSNDAIVKARQDLTQMINKLRNTAEELGVINEEDISKWVNEDRVKNARNY